MAHALGRHGHDLPADEFEPLIRVDQTDLDHPLDITDRKRPSGQALGGLCDMRGHRARLAQRAAIVSRVASGQARGIHLLGQSERPDTITGFVKTEILCKANHPTAPDWGDKIGFWQLQTERCSGIILDLFRIQEGSYG